MDLAEDLNRCAVGYPVKARAGGGGERLGRWMRRNVRNITLVLLALWAVISLFALFAGSEKAPTRLSNPYESSNHQMAENLQTELQQAHRRADSADYMRHLLVAQQALQANEPERARESLERCPQEHRHWEWHHLFTVASRDGTSIKVFTSTMPVTSMALTMDSRYLAIGAGADAPNSIRRGGEVTVFNIETRQKVWGMQVPAPVRAVAFRPIGSQLAFVSSSDKRSEDSEVQVWAFETGQVLLRRPYRNSQLTTLSYGAQDRLLISGSDGVVRVVSEQDGREILTHPVAFRGFRGRGGLHAQVLPLHPNYDRLALIRPNGSQVVILPDLQVGGPIDLGKPDRAITYYALDYDPKPEMLATAASDQTIQLWHVDSPPFRLQRVLRGHKGAVTGVSFCRVGPRLASCGADGTVRIWDLEEGEEILSLKGYDGATGVAFSRTIRTSNMIIPVGDRTPLVPDCLAVAHGNKVTILASR